MKQSCYSVIQRSFCFAAREIKQNVSFAKIEQSEQRSIEAMRTAFIVYPSSSKNLYDYADQFGKISNFLTFKRIDKHYALVEYQNINGVQKLLQSARHFPNEHRIPYSFGKCLYFHAPANYYSKRRSKSTRGRIIDVKDRILNEEELIDCHNIDKQMKLLHERFSMSDLDIRLKYFLASEVEAAAKCIFPDSKVCLFGSSVNGLGRFNGDADMMLKIENKKNQFGILNSHPLYYMSRIRPEEARQFSKHVLDILGGILGHITPQMMNVRRILRARVPIIKFIHSPTEIECDVCLNNESAIKMSHMLFQLNHLDPRFSTLVFTLRQWAKCNHIISPHPGPWLTNFMITMLILFRFQIMGAPLLPPLNRLQKDSKNFKLNEENVSCNLTLEHLIVDFFRFYATFNFDDKGISLLNGQYIDKPDPATAIHLQNPLEPELNICKNVDTKHRDIFKEACTTALQNIKAPYSPNKFGILSILSMADPEVDVLKDSSDRYYMDLNENSKECKNSGGSIIMDEMPHLQST